MRTRFDQLAKSILQRALSPLGTVETQHEVAGEVQYADIFFRPLPERAAMRATMGLLGRMTAGPCLVEAFTGTPSGDEVIDCIAKLHRLRRTIERKGKDSNDNTDRAGTPASGPGDACPHTSRATLWLLSAGRPERVLEATGAVLMEQDGDGWPAGFWRAPELLATRFVVIRDLPITRDTLLLRLLGDGSTLKNAMSELASLPEDAWEAELAMPHLLAFRVELSQDHAEDTMDYAEELQVIYNRWEARVRREAMEQGRETTLRRSLLQFYQARFGAMPPQLVAIIEDTRDIDTLESWISLFATATAEDIAAALAR